MKKTYLALLLLVVWGCTTTDGSEESDALSNAKIKNVFILKNAEQRMAFTMLNSKEKAKFWHISLTEKSSRSSFNSEQKDVIAELSNFIGEEITEDYNTLSAFRDNWLKKARTVFKDEQVYEIAYKFNPIVMNTESEDGPSNCNCNKGSLFSCGIMDTNYCPNDGSCIKPTLFGCGFLGLWPCNSICPPLDEV